MGRSRRVKLLFSDLQHGLVSITWTSDHRGLPGPGSCAASPVLYAAAKSRACAGRLGFRFQPTEHDNNRLFATRRIKTKKKVSGKDDDTAIECEDAIPSIMECH